VTTEEQTDPLAETQYLVPAAHLGPLATALGRHLPAARTSGPRPRHFVTTVHFDTPSRHRFRGDPAALAVVARERYDLYPSLADLATDPRQVVEYDPVLWLEVALPAGVRVVGVPKASLLEFLGGGPASPELVELQRPQHGAQAQAIVGEVSAACRRTGEALITDCLVNYRRLPWQDAGGQVRITLDAGVEFYAPAADLWQRPHALVRESLGPARGRQTSGILTVSAAATPAWLEDLLARFQAEERRYDEFADAALAVHGVIA
jgi:hypothetical protein